MLGVLALRYAAHGWHVFPVAPRGKLPLIPKEGGGNGYLDATTDAAQITEWWRCAPNANIGLWPGQSGLGVIDVDGPEGEAAARRHEAAGEWKEGLRCRFRGLVERLIARGAIPDVPGRTAGEFRIDLRETLPDAAADFAGAADLFERAWYGDLPTGPDEAARFEGLAERVLSGGRS